MDNHAHAESQAEFILDQSPCHKKLPEDALNIHSMNVNPGRKQPQMRSTQWNGEEQLIALPDSKPKGMRLVLQERGIDTFGMNSEDMREALSTFTDFQNPKTIVEEYIESCGHICLFLPKYHCELNPICCISWPFFRETRCILQLVYNLSTAQVQQFIIASTILWLQYSSYLISRVIYHTPFPLVLSISNRKLSIYSNWISPSTGGTLLLLRFVR